MELVYEFGRLLTRLLGPHLSTRAKAVIGIAFFSLIFLALAFFWVWEVFGPPDRVTPKPLDDEEPPEDSN
jgi:hypothetical protein